MRKVCLIVSLFITSLFCKAQHIADTITLYIDGKVEMIITIDDYDDLRKENNLIEVLNKFQSYMPTISEQLKANQADEIHYTYDSLLSVEEGDPKNIFLIEGDKIINTGFRDRAILKTEHCLIVLTSKDLTNVKDVALANCFQQLIAKLPEKSNYSQSLFFQCNEKGVTEIAEKNKSNSQGDLLELTFGTGANLTQNQWMGDLSFKADFVFNRKGNVRFNPYLSANLMYSFPGGGEMDINTFLNVGYSYNRAGKHEEPRLFGVEFGYLISREGDLFDENTFRLGFRSSSSVLKGIVVNPQLYMEDGFKRFYPGIRIGFGL